MKSIKREISEIVNCENKVVENGMVTVTTENGTYRYPESIESELKFSIPRHREYSVSDVERINRMQCALRVLTLLPADVRKAFKDDGFRLFNDNRYSIRLSVRNEVVYNVQKSVTKYGIGERAYREAYERLPLKYVI
jgi:hypothetical protein